MQNFKYLDLFTFSYAFSWKKSFFYDSNFSEIVPEGPIENKLALVQVMAWLQAGEKPLPEPMFTHMNEIQRDKLQSIFCAKHLI